jgi:poly-gamma-glutamate capsule biosynthesis protein CapA/YwtB (metallophosphatase superfamily)
MNMNDLAGWLMWLMFSLNKSQPTTAIDEAITLMAVGDVMLSRSVLEQMEKRKDFTWPFVSTAEKLKNTDITVGNLETPINKTCPPMINRMVFCAPQKVIEGLNYAGFDLMSLENNHTLNTGVHGKRETKELLKHTGITGVESGEVEIMTIKGIKIGFMALDEVSKRLNNELIREEVASAAAKVDVLVGMIHWGVEYTHEPGYRQKELGHLMVDSGMKVVIGSHPHWTQSVEEYNGGLIFYSLGNFVFDQMWSDATRLGEIAEIRYTRYELGKNTLEYNLIPVKIYEYGQPRLE